MFNGFGVAVTKNASAAQRSTIDTSRTVLIWIFFMVVPIYDIILEHFRTLQLFGFILLVFGTLVYNEILVIPFFGFNLYTKEAIKKREGEQPVRGEAKQLLDDNNAANYAAFSPNAGYDASRLKRNIQHKMEDVVNKTSEMEISEEDPAK